MPRKSFTIVSGLMTMWVEGHSALPEAMQHDVAKRSAIALFDGSSIVKLGNKSVKINGIALGQGAGKGIKIKRVHAPPYGFPIANIKCVVTTARVPGIRCKIGYLNNSIKYSRKWVAILGDEDFWQFSLGLPPLLDVQPAVIRFCTTKEAKNVRDEIYREVMSI